MTPPRLFIAFACLAMMGSAAIADVINVPEDYALIQDAINASSDGDVIQIAAGTFYERRVRPYGRSITVRGTTDNTGYPLTIIDGEWIPENWVLLCANGEGPETRFENLMITGGAGTINNNDCGGMYNNSSSPTVFNCVFIDNDGGMFNFESSPHVKNCQFLSNSNRGMHNYGVCSPIVTNCIFHGNHSGSYLGGGGMKNDAAASPTVTGCLFESNVAKDEEGGGVLNRGDSNSRFIQCTFNDNFAGVDGGGMCCENSITIVSNCLFQGNDAKIYGGGLRNEASSTIDVTDCVFIENSSYYSGAGLSSTGTPSVTNCLFSQNTARLRGGAIDLSSTSESSLTGCTFSHNTATEQFGGGVNIENSNTVSISDCIFESNNAYTSGGGLHTWDVDGLLSISNCMFRNNSSIQGGAIDSQVDENLFLANTVFLHNQATIGAAVAIRCTWLTVVGCDFRQNLSFSAGAILREDCTNGDCQIFATEFCENTEPAIVGDWTDKGDNMFSDECPNCPGDATGDFFVDVNDVLYVLSAWGSDDVNADFDENGLVDVNDVLILLSQFGEACL